MELVTYDVPWKPLVIAPLGDLQWAGRKGEIAWTHLQDHVKRGVDRGAWWIGMGDYIDFMSPSNRVRLAGAGLYDTANRVVADRALELTTELYQTLLKPTTGRWLGLLEGHHYATLESGATTDQKLAELLGARFLGTTAYIRLCFKVPANTGTATLIVWAHHGAGGGGKAHAPVLKLENLTPYWDADVFLIGHMTKVAAAPINRIHPVFHASGNRLRHRPIYLVGTGGWLKGYAEGSRVGQTPRGGYVEQRLLNPVALGAPMLACHPRKEDGTSASYIKVTVEVE